MLSPLRTKAHYTVIKLSVPSCSQIHMLVGFITEMSVADWCIYSRAGDGSTLDDDTEGSGDFKAWEAKFRCTNLRTAKKHSVG